MPGIMLQRVVCSLFSVGVTIFLYFRPLRQVIDLLATDKS